MREILFVAGEASGDSHAAGVAAELRNMGVSYTLTGVGGDRMRDAGVELIEHIRSLTVMGFVGILSQLPKHWMLLNALRDRMRSGRVALVVLVDYGGFNLHVAAAAKEAGLPVLYYITPQVWASRPGRITNLAGTVTKAAVIFKFEEELLSRSGVNAVFVGHPMLDLAKDMPTRELAKESLGLAANRRLLVLFPGSRQQEIEKHLGPFIETARLAQATDADLDVLISRAPSVTINPASCPFPIVEASSWTLLRAADGALCKSGTTTLEAAVAGCPLVIGYRAASVDYFIATQVATVTDIGMPNIIAGRRIVPEFVQDDLDPTRMAPVLSELLDPSSDRRREMIVALADVRSQLGTPGAAKRVAALAVDMAALASGHR